MYQVILLSNFIFSDSKEDMKKSTSIYVPEESKIAESYVVDKSQNVDRHKYTNGSMRSEEEEDEEYFLDTIEVLFSADY